MDKKRGVSTLLGDDEIVVRRNELYGIFAGAWGEIGRELRHCEKPENIANILDIMPNTYAQQTLWIFRQPGVEPKPAPDAARIREIRRERYEISNERYRSEMIRLEKKQYFESAEVASNMSGTTRERRQVHRAFKNLRRKYARAAFEYSTVQKKENELNSQLLRMEASFSRAELFDFATHTPRRYELNPRFLANAAAGLPYMGWRRSMQRCIGSALPESLWDNVFRAIRYLSRGAYLKTEKAFIAGFVAGIPSLPYQYERAKKQLAEDRWFVESAARQSRKLKLHPNELPFEIMKRYTRQLQTRTPIQTVLAQQSRILLSGKPR